MLTNNEILAFYLDELQRNTSITPLTVKERTIRAETIVRKLVTG